MGALAMMAASLAIAGGSLPNCPAPSNSQSKTVKPVAGGERAKEEADDQAPITLDADKTEASVSGQFVLSGDVVMKQGERTLKADHLEYDAKSQRAKVDGAVEYSDPLLIVRGSSGTYSPTLGATFEGAQFELPERNARGSARHLSVDANGKVTLEDVAFSNCPQEDMAWQLQSKRIQLDTRAREGTGRGTKVEFKDFPLIYLPYMTFPIGPQRKSGFLFPNIGASSSSGAQLEVPYYWNIRPNVDFTARPIYYAKRGLDLGGELRYLTDNQHGTLEFNYLPSDDIAKRDRTRVQLEHVAELPGEWRFRIDAADVSDSRYFEDFSQGPEGTSIAFVERLAELTYRDEHFNIRGQLQQFQTIDAELPLDERPYARTPRLLASGDWGLASDALDYGFDAEFVNFDRSVGVTGWRLDVAPRVGYDWSAPGFFVRPSVGYRYTQYGLKDEAPGTDASPTRSLPFATLDAGLVFERDAGSRGQRRITLEPRALYLYTPYRDQSNLPLFDTGIPDLNFVELFRTNRYVGADRVNDANQISVGVTSRMFNSATGAQYIAVSLGQAYYFEPPRVVLPNEPVATRNTSDYIAQVSLTAYKHWNLEAGIQWNPEDQRSERGQFRLQYRPDGDHVINLGYRLQRNLIEQTEVSAAWPINPRWNAYGRVVYSLRDDKSLERFAGFEYKACCWRLRAVARRFVSNRNGKQDTGVYLQLELNGLAGVGTPADAFLERSIRGYSPETSVP